MFNLLKKYFSRCGHTHTCEFSTWEVEAPKDQEFKANLGCVGSHYLIGMCLPLVGFL